MAISIEPMMHSWAISEVSPDPDGLPRYWIKSIIPFGFLLLAMQGISEAIRSWAKLHKNSYLLTMSKQKSLKENSLD